MREFKLERLWQPGSGFPVSSLGIKGNGLGEGTAGAKEKGRRVK